jgi:copper homeostasis protein
LVEACVDSVESALAAERGGAGRLELCDSLNDAGTTPSAGMIAAVKARVAIPVFVIVRPRGGGFVYSATEADVMMRDVDAAKRLGVDGLVIGALTTQATIDETLTHALVGAAAPLPVTFHRAFDLAADLAESLETLAAVGVRRVLTSGGAPTALEGADSIAALVRQAAGRVIVLAGGGLRESNVAEVVRRSGVAEVHVRGTKLVRTTMDPADDSIRLRKAFPNDEDAWEETDEARVRAFVALANGVEVPA